ncbi:MAG: VOC family protein [Deinococcales bacterium]
MKLHHVALGVHSIESGIELYQKLGFVLRARGKHYANGLPTAFVTNSETGVDFELIEVAGMPAPSLLHTAFVVENIAATCAQLITDGYVYEREPFFNEASRTHMAFLRHPDGVVVQINQPAS